MKEMLAVCLIVLWGFRPACGAEFQVNTRITYDQSNPCIATDANGNFIVVFSSFRHTLDGDSGGIIGRRFDSNCTALGGEFRVNATTTGNQTSPAVAMGTDGGFVAAWQGPGADQDDIFAQRFEPNGQPVGDELGVNTITAGDQLSPDVAMNSEGKFIIVWECADDPNPGNKSIRGQLYDSLGSKIGGELGISDQPSVCRYPDVVMDSNDGIIVVWTGVKTHNYIYVRCFEADGNQPFLGSMQVNNEKFSTLTRPSVAIDANDNFVIAWDGRNSDSNSENIYIKRYHWSHAPLHNEQYLVNTQQIGNQTNPSAAISDESYIVVWESNAESESTQRNIFGQRFSNEGEIPGLPIPLGDEFLVNTYVVDDQKYPYVVMKQGGEFVTVWQSNLQDGSDYGIFADTGPKAGSADFSNDGFVKFDDYCVLAEEWRKCANPLTADLIDDNKIDELDLSAFALQWLAACYECDEVDIYNDGLVNFKDYALSANNWMKQGPNLQGDITGDGIVGGDDLKGFVFYWTRSCE